MSELFLERVDQVLDDWDAVAYDGVCCDAMRWAPDQPPRKDDTTGQFDPAVLLRMVQAIERVRAEMLPMAEVFHRLLDAVGVALEQERARRR